MRSWSSPPRAGWTCSWPERRWPSNQARLATEDELGHDFAGYQLGALPPLGALLAAEGLPTVLEDEVTSVTWPRWRVG